MASTRSAADTGLPKFQRTEPAQICASIRLPTVPGWLDLAVYLGLGVIVGSAWFGVLVLCWGRS